MSRTCADSSGTIRRAALTALIALATGLAGCETLQGFVDTAPKPSARIKAVNLGALSLEQAALNFDVEIDNPYSVGLPLVDLDYAIASDGRAFLSGAAPISGSIPARGSRIVTVPATVRFADLMGALEGVRPGAVVPYTADLNLSVDAPGLGEVKLPLQKRGELPIPTVPSVALESIDWESLTLERAAALLTIRITNLNQFPLDLSRLDYALSLAGTPVVETSLRQAVSFSAGGEGVLEIPIALAPKDLGLAAFRMLTGDGAGYELGGLMNVDTPFGPLDLPFQSAGRTSFRH